MLYNGGMFAKRNTNADAGGAAAGKARARRSRRGGVEDFIRLAEYMRDSGWDGFDYKEQRRRFGRRFDGLG